MGLDMYAYVTAKDIPSVDFPEPEDAFEILCWRKHPNLHGWMEQLYREKGGTGADFNCDQLQITGADLDRLEPEVRNNTLPHTVGFFFGESLPEDRELDLLFIARAREALARGLKVYYTSWW